jgi:excisionase family DNA binding protein
MELLTVKETADMLRVSQVTVRRYIASGKLAAVRVGRNIRIRREVVEDVIEPTFKFDETKMWGYGKSDEWIREHIDEHPLMQLANIGGSDREGKTDIAENHDYHLAEAYADTHDERSIREDSGGNIGTATWPNMTAPLDEAALERLQNHPYMKLIGLIDDDGPNDYSVNHDRYLADEHADTHEE